MSQNGKYHIQWVGIGDSPTSFTLRTMSGRLRRSHRHIQNSNRSLDLETSELLIGRSDSLVKDSCAPLLLDTLEFYNRRVRQQNSPDGLFFVVGYSRMRCYRDTYYGHSDYVSMFSPVMPLKTSENENLPGRRILLTDVLTRNMVLSLSRFRHNFYSGDLSRSPNIARFFSK